MSERERSDGIHSTISIRPSLREYDIRGIVGKTLHPADAFAIGRCFGSHRRARRRQDASRSAMTAGCPARSSSAALVDGLRASGMEVIRIGLGPTPMLYYAATTQETDGAVMVTGSHNPPDYNGFKMMLGRKPFFGAQIQEIGAHGRERRRGAGDGGPRRARSTWPRTMSRALLRRLGRRRPQAEGRLGQRQRRGGRRAAQLVAACRASTSC